MAEAIFEVYDSNGNLVLALTDRVLRVLSVSDVSPSSNTFNDSEITTTSTLADGRGKGTVSNGQVTYTEGGVKRSVIMY